MVWSTGESLHPEAAAWINGVAAHVLDYDDVMTIMRGHISVAMVPELVVLAQAGFTASDCVFDGKFGYVAPHKQHALTVDAIERVEVTNSAGGHDAMQRRLPVNGLEAKFSKQYAMAAALVDRAIRLSSFDDAQIVALMPSVSVNEAAGAILLRWPHLKLILFNGSVPEQRVATRAIH